MPIPAIIVATTGRRTVLQIAQQAMGEIGMTRPTTLTAGIDENAQQLLFLLNGLAEELVAVPLWAETRAEWLLTTTLATSYDLPADWLVPLSGTTWDRTGRWPLLGPKTPAEWQYLKSGFGVAAPQYRFRFFGGQFNLFPAPIAGLVLAQEYLSSNWIAGVNPVTPTLADVPKRRATSDADYPIINERMLIEGLILKFLEAKGLDSTKAKDKFERMLEAAWSNSNSAPVLNLAGTPSSFLLSEWNIPNTGFGL